jgi:FkbH-like protein
MSNNTFAKLEWLPKPSTDFALRCKAVLNINTGVGREVQSLSTNALDQNELTRLAAAIEKLRANRTDLKPLVPFRLGLLSNATTDFIVPALVATAARHGISLEVIAGGYDQALQDALAPDSVVNRCAPDAVLIAIDHRGIPVRGYEGDAEKAREGVSVTLEYLRSIRDAIKRNSNAVCIFQTISSPPETLFGNMDVIFAGSPRGIIDSVNIGIRDSIRGSTDIVIDVAHLASTVGLADWHSPRQWNSAKIPFSDAFVPFYADHVCRAIAALRGKSRRCLILDLDNTLWGGVIGDDGLEGIQIGQGDPAGEAYLSMQQFVLDFRARGVILAVCSKNEDAVARGPFRDHPEMLLKESHIAVFQANWNDKATNIKAIAQELSLGLDAMVFLDDNPAERLLIRQALPEVAVPELPEDPALYPRTLAAAGYFETVAFSEDDIRRADFYQDNARRVALQKQAGDLESYLASLAMEITFQPFDEIGRARIAQLINKSNQFNLTTKRYTEAQIAAKQDDPSYFTLQVRLSDVFGDNGMVAVVICRRVTKEEWEIDSWLMSCRVLGRRVENMTLLAVLEQAKKEGVRKLRGTYVPTDRNKLVQEHYPKLGFRLVKAENQVSTFELDVDGADVEKAPMTVRYIGPISVGAKHKNVTDRVHPAEQAVVSSSIRAQEMTGAEALDDIESGLVEIWKDLLDRENIGIRDDFFELGGDSLLGVRLMIEIEKRYHRRFEISKLASHPTIEALARELGPRENGGQSHAIGEIESELIRIWENVLDREHIGVRDDFFELGGDSLLGVRVIIEIEKRFHQRFEISKLASHPTVEALASELGASKNGSQAEHIVPMRPTGDRTPLFCVHCGTGHVLRYRVLASLLDPKIPIYGVRAPDFRAVQALPTIEDLAALYVDDIRKIQPHGPYQLFGFCSGGTVAFEIARRLTEAGETVSILILADTSNRAYYRKMSFTEAVRHRSRYVYGRISKYGDRFFRGKWSDIYAGIRSLISWRKAKWQTASPRSESALVDPPDSRAIYNNIAMLSTISETFDPKPYAGRIHLIRAEDQKPELLNEMTFGWQNVARDGVEFCTLPGDHFSLLEKPNVTKVAETVDAWLAEAQARDRVSQLS